MREISVNEIENAVEEAFIEANTCLPEDVESSIRAALSVEKSPRARRVLGEILENARIARLERIAICQDTGVAYVFAEVGQDVHVTGGAFTDAINEGVRRAYRKAYLRKSVVRDPVFDRKNTGDNTPAIVYTDLVQGREIRLTVMPKGTGSENMSRLKMMVPADGAAGIRRFIVDVVESAGANPCPPLIVGVGVGGMMDKAALLAKRALMRPIGKRHEDPKTAALELDILDDVNALGLGAGGTGGTITALDVHIETHETHIGAMPVAVNLQCHAARHSERVL